MIRFQSGCTPNYIIDVELDENPNGLPILWVNIRDDNCRTITVVPLNKKAVSQLLVEFANKIGEM